MSAIAPYNTKIFQWFNFFHGLQFFSPVAIIYFTHITNSYAITGSILSIAFISQLLFEVPTGIFSDKIGRKHTVTLGVTAYILSLVLYGAGANVVFLYVGAIMEGLRSACFSGNNDSLLYESSMQDGDKNYHINFGQSESYFHIAATISAVLGGLIALVSLKATFIVSVIPALAMIVSSALLIEPRHSSNITEQSIPHLTGAVRYLFKNRKLRNSAAASSIEFGVGHAMFGLQIAYVSSLWPLWAVGIGRALSGLFAAVSFMLSGKFIDKLGPLNTILAAGVWGRTMGFIGIVKPTIASPAILSLSSLSFGSSTVAESTLLHNQFNSSQRATLGSITSLASGFFFMVASVGLGFIADHHGLHTGMLMGAVISIVSLVLFATLKRNKK